MNIQLESETDQSVCNLQEASNINFMGSNIRSYQNQAV